MMPLSATAPLPTAGDLTAAYVAFCPVADPAPLSIAAAARRRGWIDAPPPPPASGEAMSGIALRSPPGRPAMTLTAHQVDQGGEHFYSCGVAAPIELPALGSAIAALVHAAPAVSFGAATTTFALHDAGGWHEAVHRTPAAMSAAKAAGHFYSVMTQSGDGKAAIFSLNPRPARAGG